MPTPTKGSIYETAAGFGALVTIGPTRRPRVPLPTCGDEAAALARAELLADLAARLRAAGATGDVIEKLITRAAQRDGRALEFVIAAADTIVRGEAEQQRAKPTTFADLGRRWTSGELAQDYPDHVKRTKGGAKDGQRLEANIYPHVGDTALAEFTLDDAEKVMRSLPRAKVRTPATRRHYAILLHRVLSLAVFPLRLIATNPLPRGFLPKLGPSKAKGWLYPTEDASLLKATAVPLRWRVLYGFLNREGPRLGEAASLDVSDLDLARGIITLDKNKTDDPRAWALDPGVARGLAAWLATRGQLAPTAPLFIDDEGERIAGGLHAKRFRAHLKAAKIARPQLFERSEQRAHIRLHDTRATFVTLALAAGRSEAWVADRTGHRSSQMI